jgi:hypothetical protein
VVAIYDKLLPAAPYFIKNPKKINPASSSNMVDEIQSAISPLCTNCL